MLASRASCPAMHTHPAANSSISRPHAAVARAQPEYIYSPTDWTRSPNDPLYGPGDYSSGQWYLPHVWAPTAWATTVGSSAIRVCMVSSVMASLAHRLQAQGTAQLPQHARLRNCAVACILPEFVMRAIQMSFQARWHASCLPADRQRRAALPPGLEGQHRGRVEQVIKLAEALP